MELRELTNERTAVRPNMTLEEILAKVTAFCKFFNAKEAYLFGSYAKGTANAGSDIDIAVSGVEDIYEFKGCLDSIRTLKTIDVANLDTCGKTFYEGIRPYAIKLL
jgi:predicted nucleotidyltransferase